MTVDFEIGWVDVAPPRKKNVQHEWTDQRGYNVFLSKALPVDAYYTAIDVGRSRSANEGQLRKARGVKGGIPDFLIVWHGVTLWLECKHESSLARNQKATRDALLNNGHKWALVRSMEDIEAACVEAAIPLRATLGAIRGRMAEQQARLPVKAKRKVSTYPKISKPSAASKRFSAKFLGLPVR